MSQKFIYVLISCIIIGIYLVSCSPNSDAETMKENNPVSISPSQTVVPSLLPTPAYSGSSDTSDIQLVQVEGTVGLWMIRYNQTENNQAGNNESDNNEANHINNSDIPPSWFPKLTIDDLNLINTTVTNSEFSQMQDNEEYLMLLSQIPEENISMYGCNQGIIMRSKDNYQFFDWDYLTPMGLLPIMEYADYDGDGQKEIAVSIHIGTGTGVSVDQLYLVKSANDGAMQAYEFSREDYIKQLENTITSDYKENGLLQFYINGEKTGIGIDISKMVKDIGDYREIGFGQQIFFSISKDEISMGAIPELYLESMGAPTYDLMPNISAKVKFLNHTFTLTDFKYEEENEGESLIYDDQWKLAYIAYIQSTLNTGAWSGYQLIYLDDDDIPELVAMGIDEAQGNLVCNYFNGVVNSTQLRRLGFYFIERENLLCNSEGIMGNYYDIIYSLVDGKLTQIAAGYWGELDGSGQHLDKEGNLIYQYSWEGEDVTEDKYNQLLNSVFDKSKATEGYSNHIYSMDEIISMIESY